MRLDSAMCVAAEVCEVPDGVQCGGGDEGSVVSVVDTVHDQRLDFDSIVLIQEWGRGMWWGRGERDPGAGMTESPFLPITIAIVKVAELSSVRQCLCSQPMQIIS